MTDSAFAEKVIDVLIFTNGYRFNGVGAAGIIVNSPKEYAESAHLVQQKGKIGHGDDNSRLTYWDNKYGNQGAVDALFSQ